SLPGEQAGAFLDFLAAATGSGRCRPEDAQDLWMTWEQVREMRAAGMGFGGHTVNHPILARLSPAQQAAEIDGCRRRLEAELGEPMLAFAYPSGKPGTFNADTRRCLQAAGVRYAFSFYGGYARPGSPDEHDLPRVHVGWHMSPALFRVTLTLPEPFARIVTG